VPLTTSAIRLAAELWARSRRGGLPTAAAEALDGDVLIAAQALTLNDPNIVVATDNPVHIARFVPAGQWETIRPG